MNPRRTSRSARRPAPAAPRPSARRPPQPGAPGKRPTAPPRAKAPARRAPTGATRDACEKIWRAVAAIPRGTVATYGAVAATAGLPRRARFVSFALKAAPATLDLPWHRVVAAGGRIAFPAGSAPHREQCRRLAREGVHVERGRAPLPEAPDAATLDALLWGAPR